MPSGVLAAGIRELPGRCKGGGGEVHRLRGAAIPIYFHGFATWQALPVRET